MRKAVMILLALAAIRLLPRTLRREARALGLVTLLLQATALAAANTSKTVSVENRTGNLETRVGNLERGIFPSVSGGQVTLTGGSVTLHCGALSQLDTESQTAFLSTLSQCANPGGNLAQDPSTGSTWATGERNYINDTVVRLNNVLNSLQAHNYMAG